MAGIINLLVDGLFGTGGINVSWSDAEKISKLNLKTGMMWPLHDKEFVG